MDRRAARRAHPVHHQPARQLRATLRRRWKDLLPAVVAAAVMTACALLPVGGPPLLRGFYWGLCVGFMLTLMLGVLLLLDGSLLRRIGPSAADDVGDDLRRVRSVYGVVSNLLLDRLDADHVVLAPAGVFVVEVKWSLRPTVDLAHYFGLPADIDYTHAVAREVTGLLRYVAPGIPVHPVLLLCGPGAPRLEAVVQWQGVTVVNPMTRRAWAAFLNYNRRRVLTVDGARAAAEVLTSFRDHRITYELARR